jgi:hypothetical protein
LRHSAALLSLSRRPVAPAIRHDAVCPQCGYPPDSKASERYDTAPRAVRRSPSSPSATIAFSHVRERPAEGIRQAVEHGKAWWPPPNLHLIYPCPPRGNFVELVNNQDTGAAAAARQPPAGGGAAKVGSRGFGAETTCGPRAVTMAHISAQRRNCAISVFRAFRVVRTIQKMVVDNSTKLRIPVGRANPQGHGAGNTGPLAHRFCGRPNDGRPRARRRRPPAA